MNNADCAVPFCLVEALYVGHALCRSGDMYFLYGTDVVKMAFAFVF